MSSERTVNKEKDLIVHQRNLVVIICAILLIIDFMLTICLISSNKSIVLVPNYLTKSSTISGKRPSREYIEAVTRDIIYGFLNLNPDSLEYSARSILGMVHPKFYGEIKEQVKDFQELIKSKKMSVVFYPTEIITNNETLEAIVSGILYTYIGTKQIGKEEKVYEIKYNYNSMELKVIGFSEIKLQEGEYNEK